MASNTDLHRAPRWSRRQALKVVAAAAALPIGALALQRFGTQPSFETWQGESLGGPASLTLWHPDPAFARSTILRMRSEVERLERVFSLFDLGSEISRLNRDGRLDRASPDIVSVLAFARDIAAASDGAFDPTVQPLWRLYETHFRTRPADLSGPPGDKVATARALVDYRRIDLEPGRVRFAETGMAITLNGIAQGYITDRIADLLREEGFDHSMVEVGETRALGTRPEGSLWDIGIKDPRDPTAINRNIAIADEALSVSGGYGQRFAGSTFHHIFDPSTGRSADRLLDVAIVAPRAILADGLSTAIFVSGEAAATQLLAQYPAARAMLTRLDGSTTQFPAA